MYAIQKMTEELKYIYIYVYKIYKKNICRYIKIEIKIHCIIDR